MDVSRDGITLKRFNQIILVGFPMEAFGNNELLEAQKQLMRSKLRGIRPAEIETFNRPTANFG